MDGGVKVPPPRERRAKALDAGRVRVNDAQVMARSLRPIHHPDKRHVEMPYAPALLVERGQLLFLSGLTADEYGPITASTLSSVMSFS